MTPREKLLQKFETEYKRLNEQQRRAVDQIEGPVMVIAGPGTGKTQILSARIGKILLGEAGRAEPGRNRTANCDPLDRLEPRRGLAVHRIAEIAEMFVTPGDLQGERLADVGIDFRVTGKAVARPVDRILRLETGEDLRARRRAVRNVRPADIAGRMASTDLEILVAVFRAERDAETRQAADVELLAQIKVGRGLAERQPARIEPPRRREPAQRDVEAVDRLIVELVRPIDH